MYGGGLAEGLFCGASARFDCSQVAAHESSWLLGLPVAVWGLLYYTLMTGLALFAIVLRGADRKAACALGALLAAMGLLFDVYLGVVMVTQIGSICLNCVATYAVNLLLAVLFWRLDRGIAEPLAWGRLLPSWRALRGDDETGYFRNVVKAGLAGLTTVAMAVFLISVLGPLLEIRAYGDAEAGAFVAKLSTPPEVDMTRFEGQPALGPADAAVTAAVVGDFQCNYCRALANHLERMREAAPERIRLIFVNAPIDAQCNPAITGMSHEDACWLAEAGECAAEQGVFWGFHDWLYRRMPFAQVKKTTVDRRLAEIGLDPGRARECMGSGRSRAAVEADLALCRDLGLTTTPSVVLNGHVKRGSVFPWMLRRMVHAALRAAARDRGAAPGPGR